MESRLREHFFDLGMQYYLVGRFAAFSSLTPVTGNLFHHAIEMLMKSVLSQSLSLPELKQFGHDLKKIWRQVKCTHPIDNADDLDRTIVEIDRFERIRYPDSLLRDGMLSILNFADDPVDPPSHACGTEPLYQVGVHWVDELVESLVRMTNVNASSFTIRLNESAKAYLKRGYNPRASFRAGRRILSDSEQSVLGL